MKKIFYVNILLMILCITKVYAYEEYKIGDKITYNGSDYHVIENSDSKKNYITLLKDEVLDSKDLSMETNNNIALMSYGKDEVFCYDDRRNTSCTKNYDETVIKQVIDKWATSTFGENLYEVNGYKARLINLNDLFSLGYNYYQRIECYDSINFTLRSNNGYNYTLLTDRRNGIDYYWVCNGRNYCTESNAIYVGTESYESNSFSVTKEIVNHCNTGSYDYDRVVGDKSKDWMNYNNMSYWGMDEMFYTTDQYYMGDGFDRELMSYHEYEGRMIRPVVNVKKGSISSNNTYNIGDKITYNDEDYYVINGEDDAYVTLFKYVPLTVSQVNETKNLSNVVSYYSSNNCKTDNITGCKNSFKFSNLKKILDNWASDIIDDLVEVDKYKVRLIKYDELIENLGYTLTGDSYIITKATSDTPDFVYEQGKYYWAMNGYSDSNVYVVSDYAIEKKVYETSQIRPVINLNKCALGDKDCSDEPRKPKCDGNEIYENTILYNSFKVGDEIRYNNEFYHVVQNSDSDNNYLTLLKDDNISDTLIAKYSNNKYSNLVPFYVSDTCYSSNNITGCNNNYDTSYVKLIIDNWKNDNFEKGVLLKINGYDARPLNINDLIDNLGFKYKDGSTYTRIDDEYNYDWIFGNEENYWLMNYTLDDKNYVISIVRKDLHDVYTDNIYSLNGVRPVINIDKCAIEDGCSEIKKFIACEDIDDKPNENIDDKPNEDIEENLEKNVQIVAVSDTFKIVSKLLIAISGIIIMVGLYIYLRVIKKNEK